MPVEPNTPELDTSQLSDADRLRQATFDRALDGMTLLDDAGRFLDLNPAASELFGPSREHLLFRKLLDFADPRPAFEQTWMLLRTPQHQRGEFRIVRPDGAGRAVEFSATADLLPGRHLLILGDVSERKRLGEQLRQAQKMESLGRLAGGAIAHLGELEAEAAFLQKPFPADTLARKLRQVLEG